MSQLKKGAILNYSTIILTNVIGLLLTPFIIRKLGDAEFGLYTLIGAFVGYIAILDFGLHHTIVRFVAKYKAEKDKKGEENFLAITILIYSLISVIVIIIGAICYYNLDSIFGSSLDKEQIVKAKIMFIILIFNLAITLPGGAFKGISSGYEQFVFPKSVDISRYIIRSLVLVAILFLGGKAISIVILDTIMNIIVIIANAIFVFKKLKVKFKLHNIQMSFVKEIFSYSIWIFVFIIIAQFQWRVGQIVLGVMTDTTVVAIFAVGVMLGTYYGAFSTAISSVFLPKATQMIVANASGEELTAMMIKIGRLSFIVLMYILGAFALYGKQFVLLWVGESYYDSWIIALMIMIAYTFPLVQSFANSVLEARSKLAFKAILYLISVVIGTAIGAVLAVKNGATGMISGTIFGWLSGQIIMNFYYHRVVKINIKRFFKELFSRTMIALILILIIGYFINFIPGNGWLNFVSKSILYSLVYFLIMFYFGMIVFEKDMIKEYLYKLMKLLKIKPKTL
ncbi:O-antigen/teichoic acid export membrane protein [Aquimarina sp. MAR_2010_214]|uniref:lipopolysaccharide biosynthesis protein n=1 Tax=Aquimarina sp. MAR_2010_214 TaxID=1250026 RepID=UPI000C70ACED|nr:oligosaccharide flippase family protein [Aquimarina sp. MAR_2010_214]PKV50973.1 O-antigen/teichoic acid export membrane protein [Aquimarina sp. MAR_2010_214]